MSDGEPPSKKVILTCAQPTGILHLGNYLGAVRNWVGLLNEYDSYFGVVDMHAITLPYVPAQLRQNTLSLVAQYIACGLDPEDCNIFVQSHIQGHAELAWILGCITPLGQLERMTQFKDKARRQEAVNSGLLYYPVLMAADILLYNAGLVPVGDDQKQHLELTRDLAMRFNSAYSDTFTVPGAHIGEAGARVMSLQEPGRKMSKSDANQNATVFLTDEPAAIRKKIMSAVTDSGTAVHAGEDKPGITNLLGIYCAATAKTLRQAEEEFSGQGYGAFKKCVAEAVIELLQPVRTRYAELMADKAYLLDIVKRGDEAAQKRAWKTLSKVYRKTGFLERPG